MSIKNMDFSPGHRDALEAGEDPKKIKEYERQNRLQTISFYETLVKEAPSHEKKAYYESKLQEARNRLAMLDQQH